jgi:hypothetical protein
MVDAWFRLLVQVVWCRLIGTCFNQILSHGSYTKDTSQLDVQHHQHMPLPSMYQDHQHTITRYVSQPCTKACTKPSTCTIPSINHVPQPVQPCINVTKECLIHIPKMYLKQCAQYPRCSSNHVPQPYTISLMICLNHAIHHVP